MPEFNALYQLLNVKTKTLYSEKFSIHVIDLSRIDLATEEDLHYGIDRWAKLFKTKTWEDLRMITKNNETMQKAADSLYQLNSDAVARQCAQSRADAAPCLCFEKFCPTVNSIVPILFCAKKQNKSEQRMMGEKSRIFLNMRDKPNSRNHRYVRV